MTEPTAEEIALFKDLIGKNRYDFCRLVYIVFPFGQKGHALEHEAPYDWQMEEWYKLSKHLSNPLTRYKPYRIGVSSGNGAAKTAFGAMTNLMLMYTQRLRARVTANTKPQMTTIVWPEYDVWFNHARYSNHFFEKLGESIKAKDPALSETWRIDNFTWNEATPASVSGLHNKNFAISYTFEEAAGIPAIIWKYASGAFTDVNTIMIWMAFANSDDPESKFEQNMASPDWNTKRIDTRTLKHVNKDQIETWLAECNGDEDHDDFRVRVRGLPRKSAKDSVIAAELVEAGLEAGREYDITQVRSLPVILGVDPAWTGGDETTIWMRQGPYIRLLEKYKLNKDAGEDHATTFYKVCYWESLLGGDAVFIDQGEGTALKTLANSAGKWNWHLVAFNAQPTDNVDPKQSEYGNIRAMMYYKLKTFLQEGGVIASRLPEWRDAIKKQIPWTKGTRHKVTGKKMCESKKELIDRVGHSPDVADGAVLLFAHDVNERLDENVVDPTITDTELTYKPKDRGTDLPEHVVDYDMDQYANLYN